MKKKRLLELPVLKLSEQMYQNALNDKPEKQYPGQSKSEFKVNVYFRAAVENGILVIDVYFTKLIQEGIRVPVYRLFFDKKADGFSDFITWMSKTEKWTTARIDNLEWPSDEWNRRLYMEEEECGCIESYLDLEHLPNLVYWQWKVRERQRKEGYQRRAAKWDAIMKTVPSVPKDWEKWLLKEVIQEHYMFYEYKRKGTMTGHCSRCKKEHILIRPRYNKKGVCPNCGCPVTYKSVGKRGSIWTKSYTAHLLQRMKDGVVVRQFNTYAVYPQGKCQESEIRFWEERRFVISRTGDVSAFYYGEYKDRKMHWIKTDVCDRVPRYYYDPKYYTSKGKVYRRTLPDLAKKELKETAILEMARYFDTFSPEEYLLQVQHKPIIEKTAKAGLLQLAAEMVSGFYGIEYQDNGKLHQCLCIDRNQFKRLRAHHGGLAWLKWLQSEKLFRNGLDDEVLEWLVQNKLEPKHLIFIADRMSLRQVMQYLIRQKQVLPEESIAEILDLWKDYLQMAQKCGMDVQDSIIFRARDLKRRHDEVIRQLECCEADEKAKKLLEQYPNLNDIFHSLKEKYEYIGETYAVIVPENVQDLIYEGNTLHHCVNKTDSYFDRISKGETYILFLRKSEELSVPYYTLEVEPGGTIRQKRTKYDRQNADIADASEFLQSWQKIIQKRMEQDDRILAKKSKELRIKEYEKLRQDKVRITHGTFSGKYLIDLLEADLMEIPDAA